MAPGIKCGRDTHYCQNKWTNKEITLDIVQVFRRSKLCMCHIPYIL